MKFIFKIYNPEVIDCSTCHNTIYPDPRTRELLLEILLRVCESEVVYAIGQFNFWLDDIIFQSPRVYSYFKPQNVEERKYEFHSGEVAGINKLEGVYVEREEDARKRILREEDAKKRILRQKMPTYTLPPTYFVEAGLSGIRKMIEYIKLLYADKRDRLPNYLKDFQLRYFSFQIAVVWQMDVRSHLRKEIYETDIFFSENNFISGSAKESKFEFDFGNFGGDSLVVYSGPKYLGHLDAIQDILDEIAPGMYEADPMDREELLQAGFLKREGRKHVIPPIEEVEEMERRYDEIMNSIFKREYEEEFGKSYKGDGGGP